MLTERQVFVDYFSSHTKKKKHQNNKNPILYEYVKNVLIKVVY